MAQITAVRRGGTSQVTTFEFDEACLNDGQLRVKIFDGYTIEWAQFILKNRLNNSDTLAHDYDIVIGPIADDKVGVQIRQLLREYITLEQFQKKVEYITPTIQYFFATERAIAFLHHE